MRPWDGVKFMLRNERRFVFPPAKAWELDPLRWLGDLSDRTRVLDKETCVWRARILDKDDSGEPSESTMGAPPQWCARANRANARGIQAFYGAEDEATAVAEVQPWRGATVWVAQWAPAQELRVLDFSPDVPDQDPNRAEYCAAIARDLARPVHRDDHDLDYVPTQYIAEVAMNAEFDGLRYASAQTPCGQNLVIFFPMGKVRMVGKAYAVTVNQVRYEYGAP